MKRPVAEINIKRRPHPKLGVTISGFVNGPLSVDNIKDLSQRLTATIREFVIDRRAKLSDM